MKMAPLLIASVLLAADFAHPEADAAIADAASCGLKHPAYLSLIDCPEEHREACYASLRFFVPSLSANQYLGDQLPQRVKGTQLLRPDLDGLGWPLPAGGAVSAEYARHYRPDLAAHKQGPLVVSGLWFLSVVSDPNESGDLQYRLLYNDKPPKTLKEFDDFWGVNGTPGFEFGFFEGNSGIKAPNADKARLMQSQPTNRRGDRWITFDSKVVAGEKDPLENLLARPPKHDASEAIARVYKSLGNEGGTAQAYFLANGKGERQEKAPADIVLGDNVRGVEIKNTLDCIACHTLGMKLPTIDGYREYVLSGARIYTKDKADQREIDRFYQSPIARELARANEDYAEFVRLCNGLEPPENAANFVACIKGYDAPLGLARAAQELYTDADDLQLALGWYSRKYGLTGRLALLAQDVAISRNQWRENYGLAIKVLCEWRAE